jgi:phosphoribosylaminoimidazole-succinocarboxamide synthase
MTKLRIAVLSSGRGTTLQCVCQSIENQILNCELVCVVSNKLDDSVFTELQTQYKFNYLNVTRENGESRESYNSRLANLLGGYGADLIVLAGWNFVLDEYFIKNMPTIINLHPSLYKTFIGQNCIQKAYDSYRRGEIKYTGSMVHEVTPVVDDGPVLKEIIVPIYETDTYEHLEQRQKESEKGILIQAIQEYINRHNQELVKEGSEPYVGKVRTVADIGYNCLRLTASDRLSAFDRHVCDVPIKGALLNNMSAWWFKNTRHIIDNHYLYHRGADMIVRKAQPIKLEIIVRAYMTGSTNTSIWTMYTNGQRNIYGIDFRDGYKKNEKLDNIILTPTTKGAEDRPITPEEIKELYLNEHEWEFIADKAMRLFRYGQLVAESKGLILVDTKYEFGYVNDKIVLIDELHTCDSSRYWQKDSYAERFASNQEPIKFDKDAVRDWVKGACDPYTQPIPLVPEEVVDKVSQVYTDYNKILTGEIVSTGSLSLEAYFKNIHRYLAVIIAGSTSDAKFVEKIQKNLNDHNIYSVKHFRSAHKNTMDVMEIINSYETQHRNIIYITVAGRSNALSGVVASNTRYPVIGCPPFKDNLDMMTNINSTIMCPSKVPVMAILEPGNVALAISKIFRLN